jgi:isocitrate dehydrogenase kinase/phosphatase
LISEFEDFQAENEFVSLGLVEKIEQVCVRVVHFKTGELIHHHFFIVLVPILCLVFVRGELLNHWIVIYGLKIKQKLSLNITLN